MEIAGNVNLIKARSDAVWGAVFALALTVLSALTIKIGAFSVPFSGLPFIAVFLWPRHADALLSCVFLFAIGLLTDIISDGPLGLYALFFLLTYGVLRPDLRVGALKFRREWGVFSAWLACLAGLSFFLLNMSGQNSVRIQILIVSFGVSAVCFPVFFRLRQLLRAILKPDDPQGVV